MNEEKNLKISGYSKYNPESQMRKKINPLIEIYPALPKKIFDVIYADPPWDYSGKMQYDKSSIKTVNVGFEKKIFISAANFKYPTLKLKELKDLDVKSISADDCILFMWTTGPQMANSIELGTAWGFEYKTVAFVWDKQIHNPGRYTLSQTEFVLAFKRGRFPTPRGARNIRQLVSVHRGEHSEKPEEIIEGFKEILINETEYYYLQEKIILAGIIGDLRFPIKNLNLFLKKNLKLLRILNNQNFHFKCIIKKSCG